MASEPYTCDVNWHSNSRIFGPNGELPSHLPIRHASEWTEQLNAAFALGASAAADEVGRLREQIASAREPLHSALCSVMSEISEDAYAAGWMGGLERDLWAIVRGGVPASYGMLVVDADQIASLKALSDLIGGWTDGEKIVPLEEWEARTATDASGAMKHKENGNG